VDGLIELAHFGVRSTECEQVETVSPFGQLTCFVGVLQCFGAITELLVGTSRPERGEIVVGVRVIRVELKRECIVRYDAGEITLTLTVGRKVKGPAANSG
jgi:hypothetical protein